MTSCTSDARFGLGDATGALISNSTLVLASWLMLPPQAEKSPGKLSQTRFGNHGTFLNLENGGSRIACNVRRRGAASCTAAVQNSRIPVIPHR